MWTPPSALDRLNQAWVPALVGLHDLGRKLLGTVDVGLQHWLNCLHCDLQIVHCFPKVQGEILELALVDVVDPRKDPHRLGGDIEGNGLGCLWRRRGQGNLFCSDRRKTFLMFALCLLQPLSCGRRQGNLG